MQVSRPDVTCKEHMYNQHRLSTGKLIMLITSESKSATARDAMMAHDCLREDYFVHRTCGGCMFDTMKKRKIYRDPMPLL
eukprot:scaffold548090_cov17-Prasinocladus_malaysianus.AAC.1